MARTDMAQPKLAHLRGALDFGAPGGKGTCFLRAAGFVLDMPGAVLCLGTVRAATEAERATIPNASPVPFIHCWAEFGDMVFAPTTIEQMGFRLRPMDRAGYYAINGVRDVVRMTRRALLHLSGEIGLSAHLRHGCPVRGDVTASEAIVIASGIAYRVGELGSVLPA
jgi:hypothetical protein